MLNHYSALEVPSRLSKPDTNAETLAACVFLAKQYCNEMKVDVMVSGDPAEVVRSLARVLGFRFERGGK